VGFVERKIKDDTSTGYASTSCGICGKKEIGGFSKMIAPRLYRLCYAQNRTLNNDNMLFKTSVRGLHVHFVSDSLWFVYLKGLGCLLAY
jgi:hypothetical protein